MGGSVIRVEYLGRVAVITIDNESKLNALNQLQYYDLAEKLREVATHDEVVITLLIGKGAISQLTNYNHNLTRAPFGFLPDPQRRRHLSIGDSSLATANDAGVDPAQAKRFDLLRSFVAFNLNITHAFARHPKILVVGLNGPAVGLSAALVGHADFVYATPDAFLLTPFSSLGLVAEGGASRALVARLGTSKANEALIMSRRIGADELLATGFVNKIFADCGKGESDKFRGLVLREIDERLGDHLNAGSMLGIKALLRRPENDVVDLQNVSEVFAGLDRFMTGVPEEEFRRLVMKEKRHKL